MSKILAFAGSGRRGSFNFAAAKCAAEGARAAGADVTIIDLADYADVPIFTEDFESEHGMPEKAKQFKTLMMENDGFLIANPEYNSGYSALFKNLIDWASRMEAGEKPLQAFKGKSVALIAASPGGLGGMRVLVPVRLLLSNLNMNVLGNQLSIAKVGALVDENNNISDEATIKKLHTLARELVSHVK